MTLGIPEVKGAVKYDPFNVVPAEDRCARRMPYETCATGVHRSAGTRLARLRLARELFQTTKYWPALGAYEVVCTHPLGMVALFPRTYTSTREEEET